MRERGNVEPGNIHNAEMMLWAELLKTQRALACNSAEADGSQSRQDFIQKFHICLKEARESLQLLRALTHASPSRVDELQTLAKTCDEIIAVLVSSLKTAKSNADADLQRRRSMQQMNRGR